MAMTGVLRPGHAQIRVLDMEESVDFYTNVMGLKETGRDKSGRVYFKTWDVAEELEYHNNNSNTNSDTELEKNYNPKSIYYPLKNLPNSIKKIQIENITQKKLFSKIDLNPYMENIFFIPNEFLKKNEEEKNIFRELFIQISKLLLFLVFFFFFFFFFFMLKFGFNLRKKFVVCHLLS